MNIDPPTLQEDRTPQQLPLPQRRLSTTHYTTTCVAQDIVQPFTPTISQQLPEQHHEPSIISTPFSSLLPPNPALISSDAHDIIPTTIRTTTVSATHVVDIPPPPTLPVDVVHAATQTDPEPFCLYCQWHEHTWLPQDTERRWRAVLRREIWNVLKDQPSFIKAWCGNWAAATTEYIFRSIPLMLTSSFMSIFLACSEIDPLCNPRPHSFPHAVIPFIVLANTTLVYVIRVAFVCGVLTPLCSYTTKQRWSYVIPPLIEQFQHSLTTVTHQLPSLYFECEQVYPHPVMTSIVDYLIRIIQHECHHLDTHYQHADSLCNHNVDDDNIYGISLAALPPNRSLPTVIQQDIYVPKPPSHLFTYEADQLFDAFYAPHRNGHFLPIYHQTYHCSIPTVSHSTTRHRMTPSISTSIVQSPPNTVISSIPPIPSVPSTPHSSVFHEARELASPDFTMAPLPLETPNDPTPERTTPVAGSNPPDDDVSVISRPAIETLLTAWREALGQELRQFWTAQIAPHITHTVQDNFQNTRQQLTEMQRQVSQVRQSLSDESLRQHPRISYPELTSLPQQPLPTIRHAPPTRFRNAETNSSNTPTRIEFDMMEHEQQQRITPQYTREQPSISTLPTHWADSIAAAVTKRQKPKPLDLEEFLNDSRPTMLTEDDMERFARKQPERLTEQQTRAFADQLEQYLMHDRDNPDYIDEGNALRRLAQYIKWRTLASWLQLYANPTIRFRFSKREFWRRKYDEHAHFCMPQPHQTPDITESINRLARNLEARLDLTMPQQTNQNTQNRNYNNQQTRPFQQQRNFPNNQRNFQATNNQPSWQTRQEQHRTNNQRTPQSTTQTNNSPPYNNTHRPTYQPSDQTQQRRSSYQQQPQQSSYRPFPPRNNESRPPPNDRRQQNPIFRTNNVTEIQQEIEAIAPLHQQTPSYPAIESEQQDFP